MDSTTRGEIFAAMYRGGKTLQQIGNKFGITRERVRQVLFKIGVSCSEGGRAVRTIENRRRRSVELDQKYIRKYGCTRREYAIVRASAPSGSGARPTDAYQQHKCNARRRGIAFHLTLAEWWAIWQASGKWNERVRKKYGYAMCRFNDNGAYELGNVYIARLDDNVRDYQSRRHGKSYPHQGEAYIPMGV